MDQSSLKTKTINGVFWQFCQKGVGQLVSFAISVLLARLLMPEEFGVVALAGMFTVLTGIFIDCGMGTALVQKKDADDLDYCTLFWTQTGLSLLIYAIIFILAPWFSILFHSTKLTAVIRVLALGMIWGSLGGIQNAIITRQMAFKVYFFVTLIGSILSGIIGVCLAYYGWGVWALVAQNLSSSILGSLIIFVQVRWVPHFRFSYERFKGLFSFGWKLLVINLLSTFNHQLKGYLIGWRYSSADLAYYNRGEGIPGIIYRNVQGSIDSVMFPALSKLQDDTQAVKRALRRSMQVSSFFCMPFLFGLAAISDKLIIMLFTEKWAAAIPFMQIICLTSCFDTLSMANLQALKAIGRSDTLLKLEFIKRPVMTALLIIAVFISPLAIAASMCLYGFIAFVVNAFPNKVHISYPVTDQLIDVCPSFLCSIAMALAVFMVGRIEMNPYICIFLQIILGIFLYVVFSRKFNKENYLYVIDNVKEKVSHKKS